MGNRGAAERKSRLKLKQCTVIAASIHLIFAGADVWANPTGPQVISGAASFAQPDARTLNITNAPGTIIHWQGFSIGANEITRFIQQSASSAVLNRVVGADISQIQGQLLSNGRVFLINPSGIVIGPGAVVDTAGFVASTLNMLDGDFLAGKLRFQGDGNSGSIINQGWIRTSHGGQVILVAPQIENSGLIHTPGGELLLAAGQKLTIASLDVEGVQFEVQAPTDSVLNIGQLLADGGAVGVFAGTLRHSGDIRASALTTDAAGRVVLKAQSELRLDAGSTVSANGGNGGSITIDAGQGAARVAGQVSAKGTAGQGGDIQVLGDRVAVTEHAVIDASGSAGGGQIRVGGDYQGANPEIRNAANTFVGSAAALRADATDAGDGGRIIVWSDDKAQFYGNLSARGGPQGGNGGFAEVSGKQNLIFAGRADLGAPKGNLGTLLLDPLDLFVYSGGGANSSIIDEPTDFPQNVATVSPVTLEAIVGNVSLYASRYMRISDPINLTLPGQSFTATVGTYTAPALPDPLALSTGTIFNELEIGANITTAGGAVTLTAPTIQSVAASMISTSGGAITLNSPGATIQASLLSLNAGSGAVSAASGSFLQLGAVTGGSFSATAPGSISVGTITTTGPVSLTSSGSNISTSSISAGSGEVSLSSLSGVSTGAINTSGNVFLSATSGSVFSTVNNAVSLNASGSGTVSISSSTNLNVANVTAGGSASLTSTGGAILPTSTASQVKGFDVTLSSTDTGSGGGIGTAGTALNVDVQRDLSFTTNAAFNVLLNGTGPNRQFLVDLNPAHAMAGSYIGTMTKSSGGLTMNASADTSTVTLSSLDITGGFDQFSSLIRFRVPNGNLIASAVSVPVGNLAFASQLPVQLIANGNLTLGSYTRAAGGLSNTTTITSNTGTVTLGTVDGANNNVTVNGPAGITVSNLMTTGNVTLNAFSGSVIAAADNAGFEVSAGGILTINAGSIGTGAFTNPLDLSASAISLNSFSGAIGDTNPVVANTENLSINAASSFNVSTGSTDIKNLTISANAGGVGSGAARVASNGAIYDFNNDVDNSRFTFDLNGGSIPAGHFDGGTLSFTATSGDIRLTDPTNLGAGSLVLIANSGSINTSGESVTAANVTLRASGSVDTDTGVISATGPAGSITLNANTEVIAGDLNAPGSISIGPLFCCSFPTVSVGDIGNTTPPASLTVSGSTVDIGSITGAGAIALSANGGLLSIGGGNITTAAGSTIDLTSNGGTPFLFTSIDAGDTGTVRINSPSGIRQQFIGGVGIRAHNIELRATAGDIYAFDSVGGATYLDLLNGTNSLNLTLDTGGQALLDLNGNVFSSLDITKRTTDTLGFTGLGGGQVVAFTVNGNFDIEVSSASALDFTLNNLTGEVTTLVGGGIATGGGNLTLTSPAGLDASAGISTGGGSVVIIAGGAVTAGAISTGSPGGSIFIATSAANGHINIGGDLTTGAAGGSISLNAFGGGNITRSGNFSLTSDSAVTVTTTNGTIGVSGVPLQIASPNVTLSANRGGAATGDEGTVWATLTGTNNLSLTGAHGFDVTSDTTLTDLFVITRGSGTQSVNLAAAGQTFIFDRPNSDLFGAVTDTFQVVSVSGTPLTNATFGAFGGTLLVSGPTTINATNLTLLATNGADVSLQGTTVNPLSLSNANQTFSASGGATADILMLGKITLSATGNQTFTSSGNIRADADAGGGGGISITAPTQNFTTTGAASKMELLGGAATNESVNVTATSQQQFFASTSFNSPDMLTLRGGSGDGASATISYSGSSAQRFEMQGGVINIEGGAGQNSFAKIESTGSAQQQICRTFISCSGFAGTLNILGGSGDGASAHMTAAGSQFILSSSATNIKAGSGSGANALLQAGASQSLQLGNLTVEGMGSTGKTATAQILANGAQNINGSAVLVKAGQFAGSLARIGTTGNQTIFGSSLTLTAGGSAQTMEPFVAVPGASAIVEGSNQFISVGAITLNGGAGISGNTADAIIRNLAGGQTVTASGTMTLNGGHSESTTGIINLGTGAQSVTGNGGILLRSDPSLPPAHADSFVLIQNQADSLQTITAASGGVTLLNTGDGSVGIASAGSQTMTARFVDVSTGAGSTGNAAISAATNQRIHTTNGNFNSGRSLRVAALGTGKASIEAGASQLLEVDYPESMQVLGEPGLLVVGDVNAAGKSLIKAADQNIIAGAITLQSGGTNSLSKIEASNTQYISTVLGDLEVLGGSGANSLATIDPLIQSILVNGSVFLMGGSGSNADVSIVSGGSQFILATNGDIVLEGGTGSGADAFISAAGSPQIIAATGSIILQPDIGDAFIGGPSASSFTDFDTTSLILPLQEDLTGMVADTAPDSEEDPLLRRRAPICR